MDTGTIFMDCPAYMDEHGVVRCGLPAGVEHLHAVWSSDGPLESARIRCPCDHWFNGPVESLTWDKATSAAVPAAAAGSGAGYRFRPARKGRPRLVPAGSITARQTSPSAAGSVGFPAADVSTGRKTNCLLDRSR